jgi:hypothetical protein
MSVVEDCGKGVVQQRPRTGHRLGRRGACRAGGRASPINGISPHSEAITKLPSNPRQTASPKDGARTVREMEAHAVRKADDVNVFCPTFLKSRRATVQSGAKEEQRYGHIIPKSGILR